MSHFDIVRSYRQPTVAGLQTREISPGLADRLLAFGIDVAGFVISAPFVLGFCAVVLRDLWAVGAVIIVGCYIVVSWATCGQTFGMALANIHLVDERTGRCPSLGRVLMRTGFTLPPLVGAVVLLNEAFVPAATSQPEWVLVLSGAAALTGLISAAWAFIEPGRMLHDRLCGVVSVRSAALDRYRRAAARR